MTESGISTSHDRLETPGRRALVTLFVCGDVMTGRGIDQVLPHPSDATLHEPYIRNAADYVALAEHVHGPLPRAVEPASLWGDALDELRRAAPDARIINLETAVTTSDDFWAGKGIHYRMHPLNVGCLTAADIDCCSLANNHVLDWGYTGLAETLETLRTAHVSTAGAGRDLAEAAAPAVLQLPAKGRVLVYGVGCQSSGIPREWTATHDRPGVHLGIETSPATVERLRQSVQHVKRDGDVVVASIHWGGNWGYRIPPEQRQLARRLIDEAGVDVVHGHSSHHAKGIEVYRNRPILYGCGDFLTDYEGITGYEAFRGDLALMYFVTMDSATGTLVRLRMAPTRMRRFQVTRAAPDEADWLAAVLNREGRALGTSVEQQPDGTLELRWT